MLYGLGTNFQELYNRLAGDDGALRNVKPPRGGEIYIPTALLYTGIRTIVKQIKRYCPKTLSDRRVSRGFQSRYPARRLKFVSLVDQMERPQEIR